MKDSGSKALCASVNLYLANPTSIIANFAGWLCMDALLLDLLDWPISGGNHWTCGSTQNEVFLQFRPRIRTKNQSIELSGIFLRTSSRRIREKRAKWTCLELLAFLDFDSRDTLFLRYDEPDLETFNAPKCFWYHKEKRKQLCCFVHPSVPDAARQFWVRWRGQDVPTGLYMLICIIFMWDFVTHTYVCCRESQLQSLRS